MWLDIGSTFLAPKPAAAGKEVEGGRSTVIRRMRKVAMHTVLCGSMKRTIGGNPNMIIVVFGAYKLLYGLLLLWRVALSSVFSIGV